MATGETFLSTVADGLDTILDAARAVREYKGVMARLAEDVRLEKNTGTAWNELTFARLTASAVSEVERVNNPQAYSASKFSLTPTRIVMHTFISDRGKDRLNETARAKMGALPQNAIERKKDVDLLTVLDGATNSQPGAGASLTSGVIAAHATNIRGNATEGAIGPLRGVLHPFQRYDLYAELTAGVGTYPIGEGETAEVFKRGFTGSINEVAMFDDANITIDSSSDAKGGVFAKEGIVIVQGKAPWVFDRHEPDIGGGGVSIWHYDEYIGGERLAANTTSAWVREVYSDATAPTS